MPKKIDLTGKRFGRLLVTGESPKRDRDGNVYWDCICDCGNETTVRGRGLRDQNSAKNTRSCGCLHKDHLETKNRNFIESMIGQRYGRLLVIEHSYSHDSGYGNYFKCVCDCGEVTTVRSNAIRTGLTRSCGCLNLDTGARRLDISGMTSWQLTAVEYSHTSNINGRSVAFWLCKCSCGEVVTVPTRYISHKMAKSCGCHKPEPMTEAQKRIRARMSEGIRGSLITGKNGRSWEALVGYTLSDLVDHLERQFLPGMSWENMGEWHIDHIIPVSAFDFQSYGDKDFKYCWELPNLRPLWAADNLSKSANLTHLI